MFMTGAARILHADLDSFYASVEQRDEPRLRGRPVIVGGGVVLAASYEAKAFGVRSAMGGAQARRLCPHAVVVPPRMDAYSQASKAVFAVFRDTTPIVEGLSIDEAFLDVGGLLRVSGTPVEIAVRLRRDVRERVGLPITVGVARTKFLAKVASAVAKPDGLLVVEPDRELAFLHPLPVERLWGVGRVTAAKLHSRGVATVGEVAALEERALVAMLGPGSGRHLHALAHNRDPRPVVVGRRRRSIGSQRALGRGVRSPEELDATLVALIDRVARRLRGADRLCRTVVLRLRFGDFTRATRSHTVPWPTAETATLLATARGALAAAMPLIVQSGITLVGVSLSNLTDSAAVQLELPFEAYDGTTLDGAVDVIRDRYGTAAITRAVLLGRDPGLTVPLLPD
ncbi:MAG: polymerase [Pseudonocardiales bacterium]|nr:polymerase [Pseudonocardiales bacterium]